MAKHALLSPSGFKALMLCPAKPAMERGLADAGSEYADEGTAAHFLAAHCLEHGKAATDFIGRQIFVWTHPESDSDGCNFYEDMQGCSEPVEGRTFTVDADFAENVQAYVDLVNGRVQMYIQLGATVELFVEQAVPIGHITGEQDAEGTSDTVIVAEFPDRVLVEVIDLKFGRGVEVEAEDNPQLKLYALGAIEKFGMVYDFTHASMLISQPRVSDRPSETNCTVEELQAWARDHAAPAAQLATKVYGLPQWPNAGQESPTAYCRPHEDACRFCKAKGDCPALASKVQEALGREFTDLTTADEPEREAIVETSVATATAAGDLGAKMDAVPLVELWVKAVRAKVESVLLAGGAVAGYKLVEGKKGNRGWADAAAAETLLRKTFRLKVEDAYDLKLISPTSAEKLLKGNPKRWAKAQALITQSDGKPSVAPATDKRAALQVKPLESEFTPITDTTPATADDLV